MKSNINNFMFYVQNKSNNNTAVEELATLM
jgi:hypothetical protein